MDPSCNSPSREVKEAKGRKEDQKQLILVLTLFLWGEPPHKKVKRVRAGTLLWFRVHDEHTAYRPKRAILGRQEVWWFRKYQVRTHEPARKTGDPREVYLFVYPAPPHVASVNAIISATAANTINIAAASEYCHYNSNSCESWAFKKFLKFVVISAAVSQSTARILTATQRLIIIFIDHDIRNCGRNYNKTYNEIISICACYQYNNKIIITGFRSFFFSASLWCRTPERY